MQEYKFRGYRQDNGEWVYGDLTHKAGASDDTVIFAWLTVNTTIF